MLERVSALSGPALRSGGKDEIQERNVLTFDAPQLAEYPAGTKEVCIVVPYLNPKIVAGHLLTYGSSTYTISGVIDIRGRVEEPRYLYSPRPSQVTEALVRNEDLYISLAGIGQTGLESTYELVKEAQEQNLPHYVCLTLSTRLAEVWTIDEYPVLSMPDFEGLSVESQNDI